MKELNYGLKRLVDEHPEAHSSRSGIALDLPLVTNNTREFSRVPGLTINTWLND